MSKWAIAEYSADQVIASALNLTPMHSHLLSTTIPISNKLELTKTMIFLSDMNQDEKKHYTKQISLFMHQTQHRNIIAHYMFYVSEDGKTVNFVRSAAKGKLTLADGSTLQTTRWTAAQFEHHIRVLDSLSNELTGLQEKVMDPLHHELVQLFHNIKTRRSEVNPSEMLSTLAALMNRFSAMSESQNTEIGDDAPER